MSYPRTIIRILLITLPLHGIYAEGLNVVLQNGRPIPVSALSLEGDKFVITTATEGFQPGQSFPTTMVDHVYGDKPAAINQAIALALTGKPKMAKELLLPVVKENRITAKIPGNYWIEAAHTLLVAFACNGDTADTASLGKEISVANPAHGIDPFVSLGKALLLPDTTTGSDDRDLSLRALTTEDLPADLCAYASFFRGNDFKKAHKNTEALEAYLSVPCLYPSGGLILNAAAELQAADLLTVLKRPEEALALVESALRVSTGTVLADEARARLVTLKK